MLIDVENLSKGKNVAFDICIVGAGPAGIELARAFDGSSKSVLIVEGGFKKFDWRTQNLHRMVQPKPLFRSPDQTVDIQSPYSLDEVKKSVSQLRMYGGTMNVWGGLWMPLREVDFDDKPIYGLSSWPIGISDLSGYYQQVAEDHGLSELTVIQRQLLKGGGGELTDLEGLYPNLACKDKWESYPADKYFQTIERSANVRLVTGANVTKLQLSESGDHIGSMTVKTIQQEEHIVRARVFVLACGSIEAPRILLASNDRIGEGIGNRFGLVGKNLITHPKSFSAFLIPHAGTPRITRELVASKRYRFSISLEESLLKKHRLPNHSFTFKRSPLKFAEAASSVCYMMNFILEQLPNLNSRVYLSADRDELGVPLPVVDLNISDEDIEGFKRYKNTLKNLFLERRIGRVEEVTPSTDFVMSSHFMGTTRMSRRVEDGVVDINSRVFGTDNLYVAGASVFPTCGNANPTFTVLALAKRLAHHLASRFATF